MNRANLRRVSGVSPLGARAAGPQSGLSASPPIQVRIAYIGRPIPSAGRSSPALGARAGPFVCVSFSGIARLVIRMHTGAAPQQAAGFERQQAAAVRVSDD
ncbi:MAG TPA: hypothetical protein VGE67_13820 [Haloferula sp.]